MKQLEPTCRAPRARRRSSFASSRRKNAELARFISAWACRTYVSPQPITQFSARKTRPRSRDRVLTRARSVRHSTLLGPMNSTARVGYEKSCLASVCQRPAAPHRLAKRVDCVWRLRPQTTSFSPVCGFRQGESEALRCFLAGTKGFTFMSSAATSRACFHHGR